MIVIKRIIIGFIMVLIVFLCACSTSSDRSYESSYADDSERYSRREASSSSLGSNSNSTTNQRMVSYSASFELLVNDLGASKKIIAEEVKNFKGFLTTESTAYISARIPAENLEPFCARVRSLGKIKTEQKSGNDITDRYIDDVLRLNSLKTVRERYIKLLDKAKDVPEMLSIEKELERINSSIEVLEGRKKYAEASVAYSTVSISITDKETKPGPLGWVFYGIYSGIKWLFIWE